jgi:NTE family protein
VIEVFSFRSKRVRINLALQGGGAHGAFTWGVIDRLLDEASLDFAWLSGTSAGAVNAVALAAGLAEGGRAGARDKLRQIWDAVHEAGVADLLRLNPFLYGLSRSSQVGQVAGLFSPYEFNPLGFDPLRRLLSAHIDFDRLRRFDEIELLIAATDVETGRARLFRRHEISIEAVLASACLPTVHHAVEIDSRAYWDGGFSANPDLVNLAAESPVRDTIIVQISGVSKSGVPRSARDIAFDVNRITFNQPLLRDIELIEAARQAGRGWRSRGGRLGRLAAHRFHQIEAGRYTGSLSPESKLRPDRELLAFLRNAGRSETHKWLDRHLRDIGRRATVDLKMKYLSPAGSAPTDLAEPETEHQVPARAAAQGTKI